MGIGVFTLLTIGGESVYIALISNPLGNVWVAGLVTTAPFTAGLLYTGIWLQNSSISPERYGRIEYWCVGGLFVFMSINIAIMITMPPDSLLRLVSWARWAATIGAGVGVAIGIFEARGVERAVEAERERVRAREAQAREELLTYLNATLRHEILNTASVIIGNADIVATQQNDTQIVERMENIIEHTEEMEEVIEDVRVLLRANKGEINSEPVEVMEMLADEIATLKTTYDSVKTDISMPEQAPVLANQALRRAFSNLLRNAVEHNDSDTPRVSVTVTQDSERVTVSIADNGPGMPEARQKNPFGEGLSHDTNHGLGLTLTNNLITNLDGTIELSETGSDGTIFTITLPKADIHPGNPSEVIV